MNKDTKEWIIKWFETNTGSEKKELIGDCEVNYINAGYIDSFVFITLIGDIEEKFKIEFSNEQFLDRSFLTINGLVKIIESMVKK